MISKHPKRSMDLALGALARLNLVAQTHNDFSIRAGH
jgi:hypothetical protein